ncbi:FkbM family methyltransferase [Roseibium aggregatum]|uniref:FkbM family methyltransferase n=1 Tax=Roseibium aggregatum TaxID=187304 RepID=A0A926P3R1_9HYPH|nr:FkbM family methyltransferase [Roseibium aggregatum]MBD1549630.1 FkbM family methyltransferase [Roseibium aggregatum]
MNSIARTGLDIKVAFESGFKRKTLPVSRHEDIQDNIPIVTVHAPSDSDKVPHQIWFKRLLRAVAKYIYRLLKPAVRPIAFRVRRYLIDGLRQEIQQEIQRASAATAQEIQQEIQRASAATAQEIQQEIQTASAATAQEIQQEIQRASAATAQEIQQEIQTASAATAQEIQQEIQTASAATAQEIQQEIQTASAATAQEIQQEIQTASAATAQEIQQEIQTASAATAQEIQRASASTLASFQLLRGDLLSRLDLIEIYTAGAARKIAINCGAGEVLVRTQVGFLLCAASDHALLSCLLDTGELERGTRILIQKYLRPGDVYVDVGANVGMHTLAAARAMQGQGKIIAFEPFEPTMRMLEKSIWMNGFSKMTEIHQAAVSNTAGHKQLFIGATSGHHSLFPLEPSPNNAQGPMEVTSVRLDGVIASGQRIDLMKIDAEGAELEVIEGGTSLIAGNPDIALIVEFGSSHLRRIGSTPSQWFASFSQLGLDCRVINHESGALECWSLDELEQTESVNLFFARAESAAWGRLS